MTTSPFPPYAPRPSRCPAAFTLIELLVSMAILSLLVVLVAQLINSASATSKLQTQRLDADGQARMIFDRMALDFAGMIRRPDVDCTAYRYPGGSGDGDFKKEGNDGILFFSQAVAMSTGATQPQDSISLVGYRIYDNAADSENSFQLDRNGQGMEWSSAGAPGADGKPAIPFLSFVNPMTFSTSGEIEESSFEIDPDKAIAKYWGQDYASFNQAGSMDERNGTSTFHALSRDAFRLEFALLMKDGSFLKQDTLEFANEKQRAFKDVQAIVVTIAILDSASRQRLPNAYATLKELARKLEDEYTDAAAAKWTNTIQTDGSLPPVVTANARVYQRYFYLR